MIKINNVNKFYKKNKPNQIHVLKNINIELPEKGMVAIFGQSGCGKTTLLNVIGGLDEVNSGSILIDNKRIDKKNDRVRNKYIGYIFQNYNLNKDITNYENVSSALKLCGLTDEEEIKRRVEMAFNNVGMNNYMFRYPDTLSGGQQQRIAIARAIVKNPKIILADEPTGNLDEHNTLVVMNLLKQLSEECLVLLVTHEVDLVEHYCDKIIELKDGNIISYRNNDGKMELNNDDRRVIYLEDFERKNIKNDNLDITFYGDKKSIKLEMEVVNKNGKIYLKIKNKNLKLIDDSSEIQFKDKREKEEFVDYHNYEIIPSFEGKNYGKLFSFKESLKCGFKDVFSRKKKKKILPICMILLSIILVISVASFSTSLKYFVDAKNWVNNNVYYVSSNQSIYRDLKDSKKMEEIGVDYYNIVFKSNDYQYDRITIDCGTFESVNKFVTNSLVQIDTIIMDDSFLPSMKLVTGKKEKLDNDEVVLTTKASDYILESSTYPYIKEYDDLIGLYISSLYIDNRMCKIVGIVEKDESIVFATKYLIATNSANSLWSDYGSNLSITSDLNKDYKVDKGEIIIASRTDNFNFLNKTPGSEVTFRGEKFILKRYITYSNNYDDYIKKSNYDLMTFDEYIDSKIANDYNNLTDEELLAVKEQYINNYYYEYYLDYYFKYLDEYVKDNYYTYFNHETGFILYLAFTYNLISAKFASAGIDDDFYKAYIYKENNGTFPTKDFDLSVIANTIMKDLKSNELYNLEDEWTEAFSSNLIIFNYEDFLTIYKAYGSHEYDFKFKDTNNEMYFVHVNDKQKFESYLASKTFKSVITPQIFYSSKIMNYDKEIISSLITICVLIIIISIAIYFIMRSSLMSKVKEIGIYRAIGVSKKNLIYRFFIETLVLMTSTFFVGYLICSLMIANIYKNNYFMKSLIYYPAWLAIILLILMYIIGLIVGILPIMKLLKKTPSAILTKYDI